MSTDAALPGHSPDTPFSVSILNSKVRAWIDRLGAVWVEGQLTQVSTKPNWSMAYLTLRDVSQETSVELTCPLPVFTSMPTPPAPGDRVLILAKPVFYEGRGRFSLKVQQMRPVGIGELLAKIAAMRQAMAAEGLFAPERKKRLPLLPNRVGLITGRGSAAERDVLAVAQDRWPAVRFSIINTAVQGVRAPQEIIAALHKLDADPEVDVIIIARGGGSVEDLLPFSDEALVRAVAQAVTPVVSAIGHEPDHPVLDDVADLRAATPTDAAKRVVLDIAVEKSGVAEMEQRATAAIRALLDRESAGLADVRARPVMKDPHTPIDRMAAELSQLWALGRQSVSHRIDQELAAVGSLRAQVGALGPAATLNRGYAVVQVQVKGGDPEVLTSFKQAPPGSALRIRVADGSVTAATMGSSPAQ